jgi:hypothetical protein
MSFLFHFHESQSEFPRYQFRVQFALLKITCKTAGDDTSICTLPFSAREAWRIFMVGPEIRRRECLAGEIEIGDRI